ncbi:LOW QUALITY PROTEIN: carcinoembryonic antigen-related cell adhesion molecule 1-like [Argopecten irradians]|uniref:LOW QUALITY PROTEIN: carcinoembryonic antigen-related cell adhesion molecule 1-like n=1 Tax=Argopecten irradians TaxID=31199 RepID=UPI00371C42E4
MNKVIHSDRSNVEWKLTYRESSFTGNPPNITVSVPQTVWEGHANVSLRCQTVGEPNVLTSLSWTQTIGKTVIGNEFGANKDTLILTEVTFDDTGTYTCSASNDVPNRQGNTVQSNSALFNVKVSPKFNTSGQNYIFYRRLHEPVNINIPFYSNPPVSSKDDIEWTITTQAAPINATFNLNNHSSIDLTIKGTTVVFSGQAVVMFLDNFDQSLAGDHNITVYNDRSRRPSITTFSLNPSGPPDKSYDFKAIGATSTSITVQWTKGFNGGHTQTFVVLFGTEANGLHQNISIREEHYLTYTYEIMNLIPNTRYELNMYSYNEEGNSSFYSQNIVKRTMEEAIESPGNLAAIAGGAGGSAAALLIIVPIVIIVLYRRRNNGKQTDSHTRSNAALVEEDVEEDGIKMNVLYESAGPYLVNENDQNNGVEAGANANIGSSMGDHMYAEVRKKKKMPAAAYAEVIPKKDRKEKVEKPESGTGDLYAQVQKKEKEKKEKGKEKKKKVEKGKGKKKQKLVEADFNADSVYENVGAVGGKSDEMYGNTNAEIEQKANFARKKNKDGLIYLDLEFKDQHNGTRQVVIHGIENRNDYAIVDFTKKADPLPDSDPEENEISKPADNQ